MWIVGANHDSKVGSVYSEVLGFGTVFGKIGAIVGLLEMLCKLFKMSLNIVGMGSGWKLNV